MNVAESDLTVLRQHTANDEVLQVLNGLVIDGWPNERKECPPEIIEFWNFRGDLSIEDGIIYKCHRIVVPTVLCKQMLKLIHQGHMGMEKCILRAKQAVYWPNITSDIKQIVSQCNICQTHQKIQRKETLLPHDIAQYPWQKLGSDIFEYKGQKYVLIVDYYTKFPIVRKLGSTPDANVNSMCLCQFYLF